MPVVKQSRFGGDLASDEKDHKKFSKEIAGKKVVDSLFRKLFADPLLAPFWAEQDMETIVHQVSRGDRPTSRDVAARHTSVAALGGRGRDSTGKSPSRLRVHRVPYPHRIAHPSP